MALLEARSIQKVYTTRFGGNPVTALSNVSFSMEAGEYTVIMGESGSGKTTLLNILAALDRPTRGEVLLDRSARRISRLSAEIISVSSSRILTCWIHSLSATTSFFRWYLPERILRK